MSKGRHAVVVVVLLILSALAAIDITPPLLTAQEKKSLDSSSTTDACKECCVSCRESFYSRCSLSPVMFDKFGILNHETEMAVLDNFAQEVNSSQGAADAYVVVYGGRANKYGELEERTKRVKNYLLGFKKLDPSRVMFVTGGFREKFAFEMWLSPVKNSYPPLSPTVSPEQVRFRGKMESLNSL